MTTAIRSAALADADRLRQQYPAAFGSLRSKLIAALIVTGLVGLALFAFWRLEFSFARVMGGLGQLGHFLTLMIPPTPGSWARALTFLHALAETVAIAFLGTALAAIVAFPVGLLAARNTTVNRVVQLLARRSTDVLRGVDKLIWALIWINVVGLGPFAGVLAFFMADIGELGKVFGEAIEAADRKAEEGVIASGGSSLERIRFGVVPQVLPVIAGQSLYYFESNVRGGTIIGIVGAGGIGLHLAEQIRTLEWGTAAFIILLILITVGLIDALSSRLRHAIIGKGMIAR